MKLHIMSSDMEGKPLVSLKSHHGRTMLLEVDERQSLTTFSLLNIILEFAHYILDDSSDVQLTYGHLIDHLPIIIKSCFQRNFDDETKYHADLQSRTPSDQPGRSSDLIDGSCYSRGSREEECSVEMSLFNLLLKYTKRSRTALRTGGMAGLFSYNRQRQMLPQACNNDDTKKTNAINYSGADIRWMNDRLFTVTLCNTCESDAIKNIPQFRSLREVFETLEQLYPGDLTSGHNKNLLQSLFLTAASILHYNEDQRRWMRMSPLVE